MSSPAPERSTVDDLLHSIVEIDRALARFQRDLLPQMRRFGADLSGWALAFGENYRRASQELYAEAQRRALSPGGYLYSDLPDLENARRLSEQADRLQRAGVIAARATETAVWAAGIYRQAGARATIMMHLLDLQKRLPTLRQRSARAADRIDRFLTNDDRIFRIVAARCPGTTAEREVIDRDLRRVAESYRRLYEARARLAYYEAVFDVVVRFEPPRFAESMRELEQVGLRDRQIYLLEGNAYLQRLDRLIAGLGWEGPYYQATLPEGLRYFLGEGRAQLPAGARLRSLDAALARIRRETPPLAQPAAFGRAMVTQARVFGDPLFLYPQAAPYVRRGFVLLALVIVAALLAVTGAAAAIARWAAGLLGSARQALAAALPIHTTGQLLALVLIIMILLIPIGWVVWLYAARSRR